MKQNEVKIGGTYAAKVSDHIVPVQIARESLIFRFGGWEALNLKTGKTVRIKSAARLRYACDKAGKMIVPEKKKPCDASKAATFNEAVDKAAKMAKARTSTTPDQAAPAQNTGPQRRSELEVDKQSMAPKAPEPPKADGTMSGLDAAAKVLAESSEPLGCKEIVKRAFEKGYWTSDGKTPEATVYSAIIREISVKGTEARFRKTARGRFEVPRPSASGAM